MSKTIKRWRYTKEFTDGQSVFDYGCKYDSEILIHNFIKDEYCIPLTLKEFELLLSKDDEGTRRRRLKDMKLFQIDIWIIDSDKYDKKEK